MRPDVCSSRSCESYTHVHIAEKDRNGTNTNCQHRNRSDNWRTSVSNKTRIKWYGWELDCRASPGEGALPTLQWPSLSDATDMKLQETAGIDLPISHKYLLLTSLYEALLRALTSEEETKAPLLKSMCSGDKIQVIIPDFIPSERWNLFFKEENNMIPYFKDYAFVQNNLYKRLEWIQITQDFRAHIPEL